MKEVMKMSHKSAENPEITKLIADADDKIKEKLDVEIFGRLYFKTTTKKAVKGNVIVLVGNKIEIISSQRSFNKLFKEASK